MGEKRSSTGRGPRPSGARNGRGRRLPPEILADEEVRRLMAACSASCPTGLRNRALIAVLYRTGLRIAEALDLHPKDLDLANGAIRVLNGKGGRSRTVGVDRGASAILERWFDVRASCGLTAWQPALCTLNGTRLTEAYVRRLLPRLGRKAGIAKRVHAHGLRHTHAAQLRSEGVDVGIISKQLGHCSIATTARYLDHIAPWDVVQAISARSW